MISFCTIINLTVAIQLTAGITDWQLWLGYHTRQCAPKVVVKTPLLASPYLPTYLNCAVDSGYQTPEDRARWGGGWTPTPLVPTTHSGSGDSSLVRKAGVLVNPGQTYSWTELGWQVLRGRGSWMSLQWRGTISSTFGKAGSLSQYLTVRTCPV